jgi:hypothetical protein
MAGDTLSAWESFRFRGFFDQRTLSQCKHGPLAVSMSALTLTSDVEYLAYVYRDNKTTMPYL